MGTRCLECGSSNALPILYGLPTEKAVEGSAAGRISLDGRVKLEVVLRCLRRGVGGGRDLTGSRSWANKPKRLPYTVVIGRLAERELKSLAPDVAKRIGNRMRGLADDPHPGQSKRLKDSPNFRLRVGDYRII
jgi:hypothetical protein